MKLLIIGPRQRQESEEARARRALQASLVESYTVLVPQPGEGNWAALRRILREAAALDYDTVSAQDPFVVGLIARHLARRRHARFNVELHGDVATQPLWRRALARRVLRGADTVRVVSAPLKLYVESLGVTAPVTVLPVFVDTAPFAGLAHVPHPRFGRTLLWVGRFEAEKDPLRALTIVADVRCTLPDTGMIMLGSGSMEALLKERAQKLGVAEWVEFPGWREPAPFIAHADVALCTSQFEGFGASIVEALAAGVPVVAPDVGVAREAGATVVPRSELSGAVLKVLTGHERGHLKLPLLTKEAWARAWLASFGA